MIGVRAEYDDIKVGSIVRRFGSAGGTLWQVTEVSKKFWFDRSGEAYREFCAVSLSSRRELLWEVTSGFEVVEPKR